MRLSAVVFYKELYLPTRLEGFMKKSRFLIICVIFIALLALGNLAMAVTPVHASGGNLLLTPTPTVTVTVTPTPPTGGGNTTTTTDLLWKM